MDNVCHTLVGVAFAHAGLKHKTAFATSTAAIAANLPDIDVLVFASDVPSVAFRRGITHGVPAQVLLPLALAAIVWTLARDRTRGGQPAAHFGWLLALSYIGVLTHVGLDFLNTYGIRLLSPMSQRWFYGDAVFIVDIWLWLMLGAGAIAAARRSSRRYASAALLCATLYIGGMLISARVARQTVLDAWIARTGQPPRALMVGPVPLSLVRKSIIVDAGDHYVEGTFRWLPTEVTFDSSVTPKQDDSSAVAAARSDPRVGAFLVWSRFPFWQVRDVAEGTEVRVRDMRFKSGPGRAGFTAVSVIKRNPVPRSSFQVPRSGSEFTFRVPRSRSMSWFRVRRSQAPQRETQTRTQIRGPRNQTPNVEHDPGAERRT